MLAIEKRLQLGSLNPDEPAMIGVSGGRDSVALLDLLVGLGWRHLLVVHFDHGLREESAEDALFVAELAAARGLAFVSERGDVRAAAARKRISLETAARESRYEFFARVAHERQCARLFLAHHADDQVETFLFNLFRGSGASGLRGMRALSMRTVAGVDLEIVRPLLAVWRQEIDAYISEHGLVFREDASNAALEHTRNRLRKQVLPSLEAGFGRDVRRAVWRAAEILAAEEELIAALPPLTDARLAAKELPVADARANAGRRAAAAAPPLDARPGGGARGIRRRGSRAWSACRRAPREGESERRLPCPAPRGKAFYRAKEAEALI